MGPRRCFYHVCPLTVTLAPHTMKILLYSLVLSSSVFAQRVAVPAFTGPKAAVVRKQLNAQLCQALECVQPEKVTKRKKPDWSAAKKQGVVGIIFGKVVKVKRGLALELSVVKKAGAPSKKVIPLVKGALNSQGVVDASDFVLSRVQVAKPKEVPEAAPPPEPAEEVASNPDPRPTSTTRPETVNREEVKSVIREPDEEEKPTKSTKAMGPTPPVLVFELKAELANRKYDYTDATSVELKRYDLSIFPAPAAHLEFYPLALVMKNALAGLGIEGGIALAPYLRSSLKTDGTDISYPTNTSRIDGSLTFRFVPFDFPVSFRVFAGIRRQAFILDPVNGVGLADLPNLRYFGLRFGAHIEIPIVVDRFLVFVHGAANPVLSSSEVIGPNYFVAGSNFGIEFGGGVGVGLTSFLQVRAGFTYNSYGLKFVPAPANKYVASGANDRYLVGSVGLQLTF
jgi:hypothetical protein